MKPGYLKIVDTQKECQILNSLKKILKKCQLCPRNCNVNRLNNETGYCRASYELKIASYGPHFGEESVLVGKRGSGTIFFTHCNLGCIYCQNYDISQLGHGYTIDVHELAEIMLELQQKGCHNINFVTPTHFIPQIIEAVFIATKHGLILPLVYNCGGYENQNILKILEGIFDIYMPDFKYGDNNTGKILSGVPDYFTKACEALTEMHKQVGILKTENGIAKSGLLIRHLVLPQKMSGYEKVFSFISKNLSNHTYLNIMSQYRPCFNADKVDSVSVSLKPEEYKEAVKFAIKTGLTNLDIQGAYLL